MAYGYRDGPQGEVSIGQIFGRAFAVITDNPATILGIPFLFGALPRIIFNLAARIIGYHGTSSLAVLFLPGLYGSVGAGAAVIFFVVSFTSQGALVRATVAHADEGRRMRFGEAATIGVKFIFPLLALWLLLILGVGIGSVIFFTIPGIILCVRWAVAQPALIEEGTGVGAAFGRSADLTKGRRWLIFGLGVFLVVIALLYFSVLATISFAVVGFYREHGASSMGSLIAQILSVLIGSLISTLFTAFMATIQASLYVELRNAKEGAPSQALAEVFA